MSFSIEKCAVYLATISLTRPYKLSFTTVTEISSVIFEVILEDGRVGLAEAVPLPGYSEETKGSLLADADRFVTRMVGLDSVELDSLLKDVFPQSPFVRSAIYTACELAGGDIILPDRLHLPLLSAVSAGDDLHAVEKEVASLYEAGFRTVKLKTGRNINWDLATTKFLLDELPPDVKIRIDANQGYSFDEAVMLMGVLDHPCNHLIELVEQPFGLEEKDWERFARLASRFDHVPLMLDESIFVKTDIDRAVESGATFVKLKLFKHQGIRDLLTKAEYARSQGVQVVLGNGVASDIGNLLEAVAFQESALFFGAFEGNGFAKLESAFLDPSLRVIDGYLTWDNLQFLSIGELLDREQLEVVCRSANWSVG